MRFFYGLLLGGQLGFFGRFFGCFGLGFFGGYLFGLDFGLFGFEIAHVVYSLAIEVYALQASGFPSEAAHVAEVIAANFAALGHLYFEDKRAMQQKAFFYPNATGNPAHGDAAGVAATPVAAYDQTLKNLDAFFAAFTNFLVDFDGVSRAHVYHCALFEALLQLFDVFHIRKIVPYITPESKAC